VNRAGKAVPEKVVHLDKAGAAKKTPDFLMEELPSRLKQGAVTFRSKAQLAAAGDSNKDPSKPWPDDRKVASLGVLTIEKAAPHSDEAQKRLLFLRGSSPTG